MKKKFLEKEINYESLLYGVVWSFIFLFPILIVGQRAIDTGKFHWICVGFVWFEILPFFLTFLLHSLLLFPKLLFKGFTKTYVTLLIFIVISFFSYQHYRHPPRPDASVPAEVTQKVRNEKKPQIEIFDLGRAGGPAVVNTIFIMLLLGCNIAVKLMFNRHKEKKRIAELEKTKIEYELKHLKSQISPHFLMNMLNNIHGMVEFNPAKAQEMILQLSSMMRYVLYESSSETIPLSKEIAFINNYIVLMRERYSNKKVIIKLQTPDTDEISRISVPPLLFIIFIENAFKHGISYLDDSFLDIKIQLEQNNLSFACSNSVHVNGKVSQDKIGGIGLANIRKRLEMLFGDKFTLNIEENSQVFNIILNIPVYEN